MKLDLTPDEYSKIKFFVENPKLKECNFKIGYKIVLVDGMDGPDPIQIRKVVYALKSTNGDHYVQSVEIDHYPRMKAINISLIGESIEDAKDKIRRGYETDLLNLQTKYSIILDE